MDKKLTEEQLDHLSENLFDCAFSLTAQQVQSMVRELQQYRKTTGQPLCRINAIELGNLKKGVYAVVDIPDRHPTDTPLYIMPEVFVIPEPATISNIREICPDGVTQTEFATGWNNCRKHALDFSKIPPLMKGVDPECRGWNACRTAMKFDTTNQ